MGKIAKPRKPRKPEAYYYVCIRDGVWYGDQIAHCRPGGVEDSTMIRTTRPVPTEWLLGKEKKPGAGRPRNDPHWRVATPEEVRLLGDAAEPYVR